MPPVRVVAAAVVPSPPALVPEVAAGAAGDLDELRTSCEAAVRGLVDARPDTVVVIGSAARSGLRSHEESVDLTDYGLPGRIAGGPGPARLPLSLGLGTWLLRRAGWSGATRAYGIRPDATPEQATHLAQGVLADCAGIRIAVLCVGDGSARREDSSPRWPDPRAVGYDHGVAAALGAADLVALLALDPVQAAELAVEGRAAWQVLAGLVTQTGADLGDSRLLLATAPWGVGYFVACWRGPGPG